MEVKISMIRKMYSKEITKKKKKYNVKSIIKFIILSLKITQQMEMERKYKLTQIPQNI